MGRRKGAALLAVIVAVLALGTVAKALAHMAQSRVLHGRTYHDQCQALYLAEAGLAQARHELAANPRWTGPLEGGLEGVEGSYRLVFDGPQPGVDPHGSVNNVGGATPVPGPRGAVPPHSAYLIVAGRSGGQSRQLEAVVSHRAGPVPPFGIATSGQVHMRGDVSLDGIKSLASIESVAAGLHSNVETPDAVDVLTWKPNAPGESARVTGNVSVVSPSGRAINYDSAARIEGGVRPGSPRQALPRVNIARTLSEHATLPPPPVAGLGTTTLSSKHFHEGDLTLNGDLRLEGAALYVSGSLQVNGSISGRGAVFVGGRTDFKGDSSVATSELEGVALHSRGNVRLTGFDGSEFLRAVAAQDPEAAAHYAEYAESGARMQGSVAGVRSAARRPYVAGTLTTAQIQQLGAEGRIVEAEAVEEMIRLSQERGGYIYNTQTRRSVQEIRQLERNGIVPLVRSQLQESRAAQLAALAARVEQSPPSPTRDFLIQRLNGLADLYGAPDPELLRLDLASLMEGRPLETLASLNQAVALYASGQLPSHCPPGTTVEDVVDRALQAILHSSFDRPGQASFFGTIYTNGSLYASNEVSVVGAVWAQDDLSQQPEGELRPGDVWLGKGVRLTLNEEFVQQRGGAGSGLRRPQVVLWVEP